jgi:hypothetical protein
MKILGGEKELDYDTRVTLYRFFNAVSQLLLFLSSIEFYGLLSGNLDVQFIHKSNKLYNQCLIIIFSLNLEVLPR